MPNARMPNSGALPVGHWSFRHWALIGHWGLLIAHSTLGAGPPHRTPMRSPFFPRPAVQSVRMNALAPPLTILVATVVAAWCVLAWRRAREKRRRWRNDLCPECGYDLRENK